MNILEEIIKHKEKEISQAKTLVTEEDLLKREYFSRKCFSLKETLNDISQTGIIAEFKRKSPSKGFINKEANVEKVTRDYTLNGASALSVLTDYNFFGGSAEDFALARKNNIPILRKEFIIDPYQIVESKAMGADVILLIAACLSPNEVKNLATLAKLAGMEVLLEIHNEKELLHICTQIDMVGINNRNLKTFEVDINLSIELGKLISSDKPKIAESGINNAETINRFRQAGFKGFLMGEIFMKQEDPGAALKNFVKQLNQE